MTEMMEKLNKDFTVVYTVEETASGKVYLSIESPWKGKTQGVEYVRVYLSGYDSLTGEKIPESKVTEKFSAINTTYKSGALDYCGEYQLHFDAVLENGETVRDFREPASVTLNGSSTRPYIRYAPAKAPAGWTALSFEANCWKRCSGKVWAKYDSRFERLPAFTGQNMVFCFPVSHKSIEFICSDPTLPKPQPTK